MQPTINELQAAFNRTGLAHNGTSFKQALNDSMLHKCLVRIATLTQRKTPPVINRDVCSAPKKSAQRKSTPAKYRWDLNY